SDDHVLTYMVPLPVNSANPYGSVLFMIEEQTVRKMLLGLLQGQEGNTIIFNKDGVELVSLYDTSITEQPEFQRELISLPNGTRFSKVDGKEYAFSKVVSDTNGWTYVTMLPVEQFMQRVYEVRARAVLALVIVMAVGSGAI